jgi:hypothetical protein
MISSNKKWSVTIFTGVALSLLFFGMFGGLLQTGGMQTPVWSDNFNDGTYAPEWTVIEGTYSAASLRLECGTDIWNWIYRDSAVAEGEWQFDILVVAGARVAFMALDTSGVGADRPNDGYYLEFSASDQYVRLYRSVGGSETRIAGYTDANLAYELQQVYVTLDSSGTLNVWVNDVHQMTGQSTHHDTSAYFLVLITEEGYIDNIRVYDEIIHTTTNDGENGNGDGELMPLPIELLALAGGLIAVIIIIAVVVIVVRRRKSEP